MNRVRLALVLICFATALCPVPVQATISVVVEPVKTGDIRELLDVTGETKPFVECFVTADVAGRIEKILVENGDSVKEGQALVQLEQERSKIALQLTEANLQMVAQKVREAQRDFERNKILFDKKVVNERNFELVETTYVTAVTTLKQAKASYDLAKLNLAQTTIRAPIAGFFVNRQGFIGQGIQPGVVMGKVVELKRLLIEAKIPETFIRSIRQGQDCFIQNGQMGPGGHIGKIAHIDLYADSSRSFLVKIAMDNPDLTFKANMFIKGQVVLNVFPQVPLIPMASMVTTNEDAFVFVVEQGKARRKPVTLKAREGDLAYVDGVETGESLVVLGQHNLSDGAEVTLAEKQP